MKFLIWQSVWLYLKKIANFQMESESIFYIHKRKMGKYEILETTEKDTHSFNTSLASTGIVRQSTVPPS